MKILKQNKLKAEQAKLEVNFKINKKKNRNLKKKTI
jgi:hypothetical protein